MVVIAIIGLLSTLAVVSLNNARQKARDAKRVADVKQIQTALEMYYNDAGSYPAGSGLVIGTSGGSVAANDTDILSSTNGFDDTGAGITYMSKVPLGVTPTILTGGSTDYTYSQTSSGTGYCISFDLEAAMASLGTLTDCKADQAGIFC